MSSFTSIAMMICLRVITIDREIHISLQLILLQTILFYFALEIFYENFFQCLYLVYQCLQYYLVATSGEWMNPLLRIGCNRHILFTKGGRTELNVSTDTVISHGYANAMGRRLIHAVVVMPHVLQQHQRWDETCNPMSHLLLYLNGISYRYSRNALKCLLTKNFIYLLISSFVQVLFCLNGNKVHL